MSATHKADVDADPRVTGTRKMLLAFALRDCEVVLVFFCFSCIQNPKQQRAQMHQMQLLWLQAMMYRVVCSPCGSPLLTTSRVSFSCL